MPESPHVFHWNDLPWDGEKARPKNAPPPPQELVEAARRAGAKRKRIVRGEAGFFMNRSVLGAGFRVPPHQHDHDELLVVIDGGCRFDDALGDLGPGDSIVIHGGTVYGFTCGEEGMDFLTIRMGEATVSLEPKG